jgi:broad specificity phosphatase PhoE
MTTVYFIRHSAKEAGDFFNPRLNRQDEPISAEGRLAAESLCWYFSGIEVVSIYVSEFVRTAQTAQTLAESFGLVPVVDARLNEMNNGQIERLTDEQVQEQYPEVWQAFRERNRDFRFPGGETGEEVRQRIADFLEEKRLELDGKNMIVVCHDALIRILMCHVLEMPLYHRWKLKVDFCGITEIRYSPEDKEWKLLRFNQTARQR